MPAISRKNQGKSPEKKEEKSPQMMGETPEEILRRKRAVSAMADSRVGDNNPSSNCLSDEEPTGFAAEKPVGALCFLPKSLHRLASRAAEDRDLTSKRFFMETMLIGLEQQGVITSEQRTEALTLPPDYGWKGRKSLSSPSDSSSS